ncbi:MAG: hypothetical protein M1819_003254 [Sarea resinae]|nr:MAG: hypothetical protein M1819_003254 [Sarea resinae]
MAKVIIVTGATGKQGSSIISSLLSTAADTNLKILAVTRDPTSTGSEKLAQKSSKIKVIQGDLNDPESIFRSASAHLDLNKPQIHGLFSVQLPAGLGTSALTEETQGKQLIDAALAHGVQHFVYSSVERGGSGAAHPLGSNPTEVPHFTTKANIERHLAEKTTGAGSKMTYTVLRPVCFYENLTPDTLGKVFATAWQASVSADTKLQFVSTADIGFFGAQAFLNPEAAEYRDRAIGLAGDELTFDEANAVFAEKVGSPIPTTFGFLVKGMLWAVGEFGLMFRWFDDVGFKADVGACRKLNPSMLDFGTWLVEKSKFETIKA